MSQCECWFIHSCGDVSFFFFPIFLFSGDSHGRNPILILTKFLQNWTGIQRTGTTAPEKTLKNTGTTSGKTCTQTAREDPLLSQKTVRLCINVIQTRRSFTAGGHHPVMMRWAMMTGGFPQCVMEEMAMDAVEGLETTSRVLKTGGGCHSRLRGWRGKDCRWRRGRTQTTNSESRGWAGGERSRAEVEGGSETSVPVRGQMTKEGEQVGKEEGGTHRFLIEADEERIYIKRGTPYLKGKEEKWMAPITLGKFKAECFAALSQRKKETKNAEDSHLSCFPCCKILG